MADEHKLDPPRSRKTIQVSVTTHRKLEGLVQASQGSTSIGYAVDMLIATTSEEDFFAAAEKWWAQLRKGAEPGATKPGEVVAATGSGPKASADAAGRSEPQAGATTPAASRQP